MHRACVAAFERKANYWHMLPEAAQARKAIWKAINPHTGIKRIDEAFPLALRAATNDTEMMITFKNGSSWQVVGSDNFNSLVGSAPAGIVYSEWALANPNARAYLRPIIMENNGWQIFITTPRGRNHAHKTYLAAKSNPNAFSQIVTAEDSGIFSTEQLDDELKAYIDEFGDEYGRSKFEQEYLCSFDAANLGAILASSIGIAEKDGRIGDHIEYDPNGAGIEISADIGRRDASTWWFWQPTVGGYHIVDYDGGWGIDADEWVDRLKLKLVGRKLEKIWLPHDARAKTFTAKHSALEIFIKAFGHNKVDITPQSKKSDRVNAARKIIKRVAFSDKCDEGLEGLRAWSYEYNEVSKTFSSEPKHDWASHDGDGFSYGCLIMEMFKPPKTLESARFPVKGTRRGSIQTITVDELWQQSNNQHQSTRI